MVDSIIMLLLFVRLFVVLFYMCVCVLFCFGGVVVFVFCCCSGGGFGFNAEILKQNIPMYVLDLSIQDINK